jgi:hypothetical protein
LTVKALALVKKRALYKNRAANNKKDFTVKALALVKKKGRCIKKGRQKTEKILQSFLYKKRGAVLKKGRQLTEKI